MKKFILFFAALAACIQLFATGSIYPKNPKNNTLYGTAYAGYQGWFRAEGDSFVKKGGDWDAWGKHKHGAPADGYAAFDIWPSMGEYEIKYPTGFTNPDGTVAEVYSALDYSTVDLHFKWMRDYHTGGAIVQRYYISIGRKDKDKVVDHCLKAAKKYGVGAYFMYDLTGMPQGKVADRLISDWKNMANSYMADKDTPYLFHNGKPVVIIWGLGFNDRHFAFETTDLEKFLNFLKNDEKYGNCYIIFGVPTFFKELKHDCHNKPLLHEMMKKYASAVSPWNVGRYVRSKKDPDMLSIRYSGINLNYEQKTLEDIEWCDDNNLDYLPVIHPGFSWHNTRLLGKYRGIFNEIPREKGKFIWDMASLSVKAGAKALFVAMFDEVNESTAIYKCTNTPPKPEKCKFLDMEGLPDDYYLKLVGNMPKMIKAQKPLPQPKP
ncbi:MAG: glycoside hydrolase family 71/99-like protein [Opitutales bacterium]|nr:glycoside hydrolase family 71/99-like protein [Opitutales bacterium]